jgi:L-gulono-1,4-lactone dehydrogenase
VYALTKLQAERALQEVARESGLSFTILRPTCVYGPRVKSYTVIPLGLINKGMPVILGDGRGVMDAVYVEDLANAVLLAARSPHAAGEIFNIGHETVTLKDFYSYYGAMLNRPVRHLPVPVVETASRLLQLLPATARTSELRRGARFLIATSRNRKPFPSTKAMQLVGYRPEFGLRTGMLKTQLWARAEAHLPDTRYSLGSYGPLPFRPAAIVHPQTEQEIVQVIRTAADSGVTARAIGSLHSLCPVPYTDGVCLVLDRYAQLVSVDGPLVTVQAGMTLRSLNQLLAERTLALPVGGSIVDQTVSGAISTATHGGSIHHGSLSDYVEAVRIVKADGTAVDIDRTQPVFEAAVVSLGLLGVVSTVTLRCVPSFSLQSRSVVRPAEEVLADFDGINRRSLHIDMLYFPITDQFEILVVDPLEGQSDVSHGQADVVPPFKTTGVAARLAHRVAIACIKTLAWLIQRFSLSSIQRLVTGFSVGTSHRARAGRSDFVLAFGDRGANAPRSPLTIQDMEIAVPYDQARAAIAALRDLFRRTRKYPLLPLHIRCSPRSRHWLSPAYDRDVCWIELWQYPRSDRRLAEIHELMKPLRYRFHWGKETRADADYISGQYERWDDFVQLRHDWDPRGIFLNPYLDAFFSTRKSLPAPVMNPR